MSAIIRGADLDLLETPGGNFSASLASAGRGATEVNIVLQQQEPGGRNPRHTHDREEVLVLRRGRVTVTLGEEQVSLMAGDTLIVPAHTAHQVENAGDEGAE